MTRLSADAHALTVFRVLPDGGSREYTATTFPRNPRRGCERMIRTGLAVGYLRADGDGYAVLDVLNENGDIVQDYTVTTAAAFRWLYRKLDLRVAG